MPLDPGIRRELDDRDHVEGAADEGGAEQLRVGWQDTDHGSRPAGDADAATYERAVAGITARPESMGEDDNVARFTSLLFRSEQPTELRTQAEDMEEVGAGTEQRDVLRPRRSGE